MRTVQQHHEGIPAKRAAVPHRQHHSDRNSSDDGTLRSRLRATVRLPAKLLTDLRRERQGGRSGSRRRTEGSAEQRGDEKQTRPHAPATTPSEQKSRLTQGRGQPDHDEERHLVAAERARDTRVKRPYTTHCALNAPPLIADEEVAARSLTAREREPLAVVPATCPIQSGPAPSAGSALTSGWLPAGTTDVDDFHIGGVVARSGT